ncbi:ABC transporter ATP-binding protein [Mesorhizobium sp. DCY119]|uniref:ABC transporter ATP-binding protein n=1 Tax=Mesorhizobium sp. DCY119 TaxID=2108445 RepID=UPI000E73A5DE|nr:ABC transporter ATP-binding protein [Mesorhizobium sp. DCY119]RJG41449.1 ABC transporter ATP-binding protein [Mesorhizobium sp. DCY119]
MSVLVAKGIRKNYGSLEVLKGVDLSVGAGETFAIIGPNGAGKTTLFKVLTGEVSAQGGSVSFDGKDVTRLPAFVRARMGFGRTFQVARVFGELSIFTNVVLAIEARKVNGGESCGRWWDWRPSIETSDEARSLLESVGLGRQGDEEAGLLSHGDKKRLEFAVTLASKPRILMLDEPTAGMSAADRKSTTNLLHDLKAQGITIIMTEHDMDVIFDLANRLMVLNYGAVVSQGDPVTVREDDMVKQVYLGKGVGHA